MVQTNPTLKTLFSVAARSARLGDYGDAALCLKDALALLGSILHTSKIVSPQMLDKIKYSLETLFLMQKQSDWVALADVIEFELLVLIAPLDPA